MATYSFSFIITDYVAPFVSDLSPYDNETGIDGYTLISFNLLDDYSGVDLNNIDVLINDDYAFVGPNTFYPSWSGQGHSISQTNVDGYDGYNIILKSTNLLLPRTIHSIRIVAKDNNANLLDQTTYFTTGTSISSLSVGTYEINVIVTYNGNMTLNSNLFNPANYVFNNGMYARNVAIIDSQNVLLEVELFHTNTDFSLSVKNVIDEYGNEIPQSYNLATINPLQSDANISNFNGKIRTWRSGNVIQADSERIYIAGDRGIDVFRKLNPSNPVRWGQILDEYGAQAMFLLNYPDDLIITDTSAPYLVDLNPDENTTSPSVSTIELTITDLNTAVEPTSTTIYVNNDLAFRGGYGGWLNNYSGNLVVEYKKLNFTLIPPIAFSINDVIIVRVLATDLLGNSLDKTYQFSIGTSVIIEGWGGQNWGSYDAYGLALFGWGGL